MVEGRYHTGYVRGGGEGHLRLGMIASGEGVPVGEAKKNP